MKLVLAFVQPFLVDKIIQALQGIQGVSGASFSQVRGFGRGGSQAAGATRREELLGALGKTRVEVAVPARLEQAVVEAIRKAAHTGRKGDGKIFVLPLERAVRIRTGEEGDAAV